MIPFQIIHSETISGVIEEFPVFNRSYSNATAYYRSLGRYQLNQDRQDEPEHVFLPGPLVPLIVRLEAPIFVEDADECVQSTVFRNLQSNLLV